MDPDPEQSLNILNTLLQSSIISAPWLTILLFILLLSVLIFFSALISGSENAFFSLEPKDFESLKEKEQNSAQIAHELLTQPDKAYAGKRLLATILILNNFINISIVVISSLFIDSLLEGKSIDSFTLFLIKVVLVTFVLVLLGEIIPKIYATQNNIRLSIFMAKPLKFFSKILRPLIEILIKSSSIFDRYSENDSQNVSLDELSQAIEITQNAHTEEEKNILKGLLGLRSKTVKQVMKPRNEVSAISADENFGYVVKKIKEWHYSRIPIYLDSFDNIQGILFVKDIMAHLEDGIHFSWQETLRPAIYVPEQKKLSDMLDEFREKRTHMAIVVDEYGGSSGIVTLEDVLEEVFGEIIDEFDEEESLYTIIDDKNYLFEAKIPLVDMLKILNLHVEYFDEVKGDSDSLGGLVMEFTESIPKIGHLVNYKDLELLVDLADSRRIHRVKVKIK